MVRQKVSQGAVPSVRRFRAEFFGVPRPTHLSFDRFKLGDAIGDGPVERRIFYGWGGNAGRREMEGRMLKLVCRRAVAACALACGVATAPAP